MSKHFDRLQIVLVRAENPINIGQSARAMKNFGLSKLILVGCADHKVESAYTTGWKARDILKRAKCTRLLSQALAKSVFAVGFTTRAGRRRGARRDFQECVDQILKTIQKRPVALVFGNEKNGLSNAEAAHCQALVTIPTDAVYPQLNLSHAVAAVLAILRCKASQSQKTTSRYQASAEEFDAFIARYHTLLKRLAYQNSAKTSLLDDMTRELAHYFKKSGMDERELHLFQGVLSRILQRIPG